MNIQFEKNAYFYCVEQKYYDFNDKEKFFNFSQKILQFSYGDVSYEQYIPKYSSEGWFERKIIALPKAFWSGIIMTIYHLAKGIIENRKYPSASATFQYIYRDLEESFGWTSALFNDRYGTYHIQKSQFNRSCYDYFLNNILQNNFPKPETKKTSTLPFESFATQKDPVKPASRVKEQKNEANFSINYDTEQQLLNKVIDCYLKGQLLPFIFFQTPSSMNNNFNPFFKNYFQPGPRPTKINFNPFFKNYFQPRPRPMNNNFNANFQQPPKPMNYNFNNFFQQDPSSFNFHQKNESKDIKEAYYTTLGLNSTASKEDVRTAYKKLVRLYHPDKIIKKDNENENDFQIRKKGAEEKFKLISEAYNRLIDE